MKKEMIDKLKMIAEASGKAYGNIPAMTVNKLSLSENAKEIRFTHYADPEGAMEIAKDIREAMLPFGYLAHSPERHQITDNFFEYGIKYDG